MKTRLFILTLCGLLVGFSANAQDYVFKVLATKGDNTFKSASGSDWETLRTGTKLNGGDMIKTGEGCYLALLHSSGKPLEIKEAKEFAVDDLSAQVGGGESSVISKYADYVASKMTPEAKEENRKKYASITGATERGLEQIKFYMETSADIYNPIAIVRWEDQKEAESYQVTLKDMFDEVLMVAETQESYFEIDFMDDRLKEMDLVIVNVSVKGNEDTDSGDYAIQRITDDDAQEYLVELNDLKTSLDQGSAISNLILAEFYEQNDLMLDALTSYEYAIQQSPDVEYFKDAYREFLMRNGYSDKIE